MIMLDDANDIVDIDSKETCINKLRVDDLKDSGAKKSMQFLIWKSRITRWDISIQGFLQCTTLTLLSNMMNDKRTSIADKLKLMRFRKK